MVLVRQYFFELLLGSFVNHDTERIVAWKKCNHRTLVLNKIERFIHLSITLLFGPLAHLLGKFVTISFIKDRAVSDSLKTWSFVKRVCWELVVGVDLLPLLVNGRHIISKIEQEKNILT